MTQVDDLSRSLITFEQNSTMVVVLEMRDHMPDWINRARLHRGGHWPSGYRRQAVETWLLRIGIPKPPSVPSFYAPCDRADATWTEVQDLGFLLCNASSNCIAQPSPLRTGPVAAHSSLSISLPLTIRAEIASNMSCQLSSDRARARS